MKVERVLVWCAARGIPLWGPSGASEHLRALARALGRAGHRVRVVTPSAVDERGGSAADLEATHHALRWPGGLRTLGARLDGHVRWSLATRCFAPDLVWERFDPSSAAPARRARCARLVEVNAPVAWERRWPEPPRQAEIERMRRILEGADRVIAVSAWLRDHLAEVGVPALHVPNGVEPRPPGDREATRRRLGLRGPVVVFLGSMSRWQGADRLPALLDALGPRWTGLAVGDGERPPAPHPRLVRTGRAPPDGIPDLLAAADVGLAPYDPAGPPWFCPLKVLEYRAAGLPVVATRIGDAAALVGAHGAALGHLDPGGWAEAIERAATLPRRAWARTWDDVAREALTDLDVIRHITRSALVSPPLPRIAGEGWGEGKRSSGDRDAP